VTRVLGFAPSTIAELSGWLSDPWYNKYLDSWLPRSPWECASAKLPDESLFRATGVLGPVGNVLCHFTVAVAERARFQRFGYRTVEPKQMPTLGNNQDCCEC